jgi:hypothetical protein
MSSFRWSLAVTALFPVGCRDGFVFFIRTPLQTWRVSLMICRVEETEGIGPVYAAKRLETGIKTTSL